MLALALAVALTSTTDISAYAKEVQVREGLSDAFYQTIKCESGFQNVQSYVIRKDGTREDSWGVVQWHLPAGNKNEHGVTITKEMALDPRASIDTMAWYFKNGWQRKWSCYRKLHSS